MTSRGSSASADPARAALLGTVAAAYLLPQWRAEEWVVKAGVMELAAVGLGGWALWRAALRPERFRDGLTAWGLFAGWTAATILWSVDPVRSVGQVLALGGFAAVALLGTVRIEARLLSLGLVGCAAVEAAAGWLGGESGRSSGLFVDANHHAVLLVMGAAACAAWAAGSRWPRTLAPAIGAAVLAAAAGQSGSRAVVLGLGAAAVVVWLTGRGRKGTTRWIALAGLAAGLGLSLNLFARAADEWHGLEPSAWERWWIWRSALATAIAHPLGVGLGGLGDFLVRTVPGRGAAGESLVLSSDYAHSEPLQVLAELGFPGLLLAGWAGRSWWLRRNLPTTRGGGVDPATTAVLASLAALGVMACVEFPLHVPLLAFVGVLGMASLVRNESLADPGRTPANRRWLRPAFGGLGLAAAAWIVGAGLAQWHYLKASRASLGGDAAMARSECEAALGYLPVHAGALRGLAVLEPTDPRSAERLALAQRLRPTWRAFAEPDGARHADRTPVTAREAR